MPVIDEVEVTNKAEAFRFLTSVRSYLNWISGFDGSQYTNRGAEDLVETARQSVKEDAWQEKTMHIGLIDLAWTDAAKWRYVHVVTKGVA